MVKPVRWQPSGTGKKLTSIPYELWCSAGSQIFAVIFVTA
jgi:hypothetical protein